MKQHRSLGSHNFLLKICSSRAAALRKASRTMLFHSPRLSVKYQFQFFFYRSAEFIRAGHLYYIVSFG